MKKKTSRLYGLFMALLVAYCSISFFANPPNDNGGYTGAPPNNLTCTNCHSGGTGTGNITITGLPATITASTVYPITVSVTRTNNDPLLGGFQLLALNATNNNVGTLSNAGASSTIQTLGGRTFFEHSPAQSFGPNTVTYTVDWTSPSSGSGAITMYAAGNLANDNNNTSGDAIVTTTAVGTMVMAPVINVSVTGTNVSCFNGSNGSATANATGGGGGPYFYEWSNGGSTQTINNLTAGTYSVTVTNGAGGIGSGFINITQPATPVTVAIINQTNITCVNPVGTATAQANGGTPNWTYSWSNGDTGPSASFTMPGNYTVTATDANGCTATTSVNILNLVVIPIAEAGPTAVINCTNPTVFLNGSGTSMGSGITYLWTTVNGLILNGQNTLFPEVGAPGTYTLTVTNNNNGCTGTDNTTVTGSIVPPIANAGPNKALNCTITCVELDGTGSSSGPSITYLWTTPNGNFKSSPNTSSPTVDAPGTYNLLVTNTANGCTATDQVIVTEDIAQPSSNAGSDKTLTCTTTSLQLNGTASTGPNFTYLWTTANGHIVSGETTLNVTVDEPGTYCLAVTNTTNGCTASDCATVGENITAPLADAGSAAPLTCTTTSVQLNGSASSSGNDFSYLWTTVNGHFVSGETTTMPIVDDPGTYTIRVTNAVNGCTATASVTVTENIAAPTADAGPAMALNCNNTTVTLDGSGSSQGGNFTYLWSGTGIQSGGNTPNPTVNAAGSFSILVTNTANGCTATDNTTVSQTPPLTAAVPTQQNVACNGDATGSATAQGTGGNGAYTYAWSNSATTQMISGLAANTYTVTLTDADNCTATATATITEPTELLANASATGESSSGAMDGTATAAPTGGVPGYAYLWSNGSNTATISGLPAGNYSVTVTDQNNCTAVETVTVASFDCANFSVGFSKTNPSCNGGTNGTATAEPTGDASPFSFNWSNGGTEATITGLAAGTYTVTVMDGNDCEVTGNVTLNEPPALNLTATQATNVLCNGESNGSATVAASGGTGGYTFEWADGSTAASRSDLAAGQYTVTATDANGCTTTTQFSISQPPALTVNLTSTGETSVNADDGTANAPASGGTQPFNYEWSNGATTSSLTNLPPGEYCVSVTDANGCTFEGCTTVSQFGCAGANTAVSGQDVTCFGEANGTASVTASGFADPVGYAWSNGATAANIGSLGPGTYTVTVTGANGCTAEDEIEIEEPTELTVGLLSVTNLVCPDDPNGEISVAGNGGSPAYAYTWSNGQSTATNSGLGAGIYEVTVQDQNGCEETLQAEVGTDPDNEAPTVATQDITVQLAANGTVTIAPGQVDDGSFDNCGITDLSLDVTSFTCADLGENVVTLTATDAAGNSNSALAIVTVTSSLAANATAIPASCFGSTDGSAIATPSGGTSPYSYLWSDAQAQTTMTAIGLSAGEYTCIVTDAAGCTTEVSTTVVEPTGIGISVDQVTDETVGNMDGAISVTVIGGVGGYTYEWSLNGSTVSTDEDPTGLAAGGYILVVTDAGGCTREINVTVDLLDSATDQVLERLLSVFPNPASGQMNIRFVLPQTSVVRLSLLDVTGRLALPELREELSSRTLTIDVGGLPTGVYYLRAVVDGSVAVKRAVVR